MKSTIFALLLFTLSLNAKEFIPGEMNEVKRAVLASDPSTYEIVISEKVAALYWKESK